MIASKFFVKPLVEPNNTMQAMSSPLDQLADIHLPDPVSWWPLALGWWLLILLFITLCISSYFMLQRRSARRYRNIAASELTASYNQYLSDKNTAVYLQCVSQLLRRVAITSFGKHFDVNLKGEDWLKFLDNTCPKVNASFTTSMGDLLLVGPYQKTPAGNIAELQRLALMWIAQHHTKIKRNSTRAKSEVAHV